MIKFWKSAAKGKTGCPVRPPEPIQNVQSELLNTEQNIDIDDNVFEKKSSLCISLNDILYGKVAIKHFITYMEGINQQCHIKCWFELENFKVCFYNSKENNDEFRAKLIHTRSLDNHSHEIDFEKNSESFTSQISNWRSSIPNLRKTKSECSSSSPVDFKNQDNCNFISDKNVDITEKAISIFKKYVALEAPNKLELSDSVRKLVISNICKPEGQIEEDCFKAVQDALYYTIEKDFFSGFQDSPLYIKSQIDILTSGCLCLKDILYNETILFYYTEYLEQENCSKLLEFLISVTNFRDNLINNNPSLEQAQGDAIVLYDKYFSLQATSPLGFSSDVRLKVESDICSELGPIASCFDYPYKIIYKTLSRYVKTFLSSELYYTYLSEMMKSVNQMWSANYKSYSDCSSEFSISTQNTLLAMGDQKFRKKRNHSVPDMTIDSNQLYNADSLWQRKKYDGLSLGRINSLGRFESKFEPDPDKKCKSVLKKMVSKFTPTTSSKVEEEMAWQIAHMIVKDVTDLTMSPPENDNDNI
ncbi:A-kinase anchor protein 10, mitochondrial [Danaus plexippus]|uniref:A-kinase anchor protein 10, mitochondrial n=1 Tax=Danaus plexippus TaxID=13037 RepID=UPI002AAF0AC2|nr:A-kinase anchor protein 10, mitochondrial [Danaus plexippus]